MPLIHSIKRGAYHDSVSLMRTAQTLSKIPGVSDAALVMGTPSNRDILTMSGLNSPDFDSAGDSDLLIAIRYDAPADQVGLINRVESLLTPKRDDSSGTQHRPASLEAGMHALPAANLVLISVAGRYAGDLARRALDLGMHVMLFSDNVPIETEVELKRLGREKGLLVMGPDCGTAIINGTPLGFANAVNRGNIGIVAAAGTGLQEVSCLISNQGAGISQAIGVGGHDLSLDVGGIMFIEAIKALDADPDTHVILLVSKPPHPSVKQSIEDLIRTIRKPVISLLLGQATQGQPVTLEDAAFAAVRQSMGMHRDSTSTDIREGMDEISAAAHQIGRVAPGRRFIRGLFSGGTFCAEAQIILNQTLRGVFSNAPTAGSIALDNPLISREHTIVDLGDDAFTVGRLHPMIDYTLRKKRILDEARDPDTAVILLDVVLGYGSNMDPAFELHEVIHTAAQTVAIVCSVTGTDADPQCRSRVIEALRAAGAHVMPSNASACRLAGQIVSNL